MFWNIARGLKRSASVKLLGKGSGVTSSKCCHRVVVAFKCSGTSTGHVEICFCQAAWRGLWCDVKLLGVELSIGRVSSASAITVTSASAVTAGARAAQVMSGALGDVSVR